MRNFPGLYILLNSSNLFQFSRNSYDFHIVVSDEINDVGTDIARSDIGLNALQRIEHRSSRLIKVTVALCDIINLLGSEAMLVHYDGIDSVICGRIVGDYNVGWNIAENSATALDENPVADLATLVHHRSR